MKILREKPTGDFRSVEVKREVEKEITARLEKEYNDAKITQPKLQVQQNFVIKRRQLAEQKKQEAEDAIERQRKMAKEEQDLEEELLAGL